MANEMKLLMAFIEASGFDVEEVDTSPLKHDRYPHTPIIDYKVTKKPDPLLTLYKGVPLSQLVKNVYELSISNHSERWIKYPEDQFHAVVNWFGCMADKQSDTYYLIHGVEVFLDEKA